MKTCLGWRLKFTYVLLFNLIASPVVLAKQCYNRDGSIELTHTPCLDAPRNTHCCQPGAACLANGLCFLEDNSSLNTGTCTEQGWDELSCFQTCFETIGYDLDAPSTLYRCDDNFWCCSRGSNTTSCCSEEKRSFKLITGSRAKIQNGTNFAPGYTISPIAALAPSSPLSSQTVVPSVVTSNDESPLPDSRQTIVLSSSEPVKGDNGTTLKTGLGAGLGVGIPLLLALAGALLLLAREKKMNRCLRRDLGMKLEEPPFKRNETLSHDSAYPELAAKEPGASELPNSHVGAPT